MALVLTEHVDEDVRQDGVDSLRQPPTDLERVIAAPMPPTSLVETPGDGVSNLVGGA